MPYLQEDLIKVTHPLGAALFFDAIGPLATLGVHIRRLTSKGWTKPTPIFILADFGGLMENFFAVLHVVIAIALVLVILVQDPKGGSAGLFGGGGGSNSIFGATGTPTLLSKATRYLGIAFAATCIGLSLESCQEGSVTDRALEMAIPAPQQQEAPAEAPAESAPTSEAPADSQE